MKSREQNAEETVARRIVMRRSTWEMLTRVSEALRETRDVEVTPAEVARVALEAGLEEVRRGVGLKAEKAIETAGLVGDDKAELEALLDGTQSVRGRQRTIALWLGLRRKQIGVEDLRGLAVRYDAYNVANFAQNMKKDGTYFKERRSDGKRVGWKLTRAGQREVKALLSEALAAV